MKVETFYGNLQTKKGGRHHEITYNKNMEVVKQWARIGEKGRRWFRENNVWANQSGFWLFQWIYKRLSLNATALKCFQEGRITEARYNYLVTPVFPE